MEDAIRARRSVRRFSDAPLTLDELAFLLWCTQGITRTFRSGSAFRTVPSAGARHAFETYLCVLKVESLPVGVYRYLPVDHALVAVRGGDDLVYRLNQAALGQTFVGESAVTFVWSAIPYRMEWRYGAAAYKVIALDAGHVCQSLYLACEAIHAGTCAIAAYNQREMDTLIDVDGEDEFTIYLAPVGKKGR